MITVATEIVVGAEVRRYDDPFLWDTYDVGTVRQIDDGWVIVDFYDWVERWPMEKFLTWQPFLTQCEVLVPVGQGEVVQLFRPMM